VLLSLAKLSAAALGSQTLAASTDQRFTFLHQAHTQTIDRIQNDIEALNDAKGSYKAALEAKRDLRKRLVEAHRRYRIALLDLRQSAIASDDDDLATTIGNEIENTNGLILAAEERLAQRGQMTVESDDRLPAGLEQGLVLHYPFDMSYGSKIIDTSGRGNHGVARGARWSTRGRRKGAFWLDGIDDYLEAPDTEALRTNSTLTLSVCVYREPDESLKQGFFECVLSKSDVLGEDYRLEISANHTVGAILRHRHKDGQQIRVPADPARHNLDVKKWVHIVLVYDGHLVHTYVDGQRDKTVMAPGGIGITDAPLNIGRCGNGSWHYGFTGRLDDVLIWNRALTEVEVLGLWVSLQRTAAKLN
jgi:exonuclease VII small subunit